MSKSKRKTTGRRKARPTIAYLTTELYSHVAQWTGVFDAAQEHDVNLISFPGASLNIPTGFEAQANILYELIDTENIDGLITWASTIGNYATLEELQAFHERYRPLPMVTIGRTLEGLPSLLMDSYEGMREAIEHMIEVHGYRRLAFIRGPEAHLYAQERYRAYTETLEAHGILLNPNLVAPYSMWGRDRGAEMMQLLLDERNLLPQADFEAIVAASDDMLLGALDVLQARGIRVPTDVAIAGFDNREEGKTTTPPLTSVAAPFYDVGHQALETMLALMAGEQIPDVLTVPSRLVVRQSCGCLNPAVLHAAKLPLTVERVEVDETELEAALVAQRTEIAAAMAQAVEELGGGLDPGWAGQLLDGLAVELGRESAGAFLDALDEILRQVAESADDVAAMQNAVSTLRHSTLPYLDGEALSQAENLWQQARVLLGETMRRIQAREQLQADQRAESLRELGAALITTFDLEDLMDVLAEGLPQVGIPSAYLSLYEEPQSYTYPQPAPEWSRLVLAYSEAGKRSGKSSGPKRVEIEAGGRRFQSRRLVPEGLLPQDGQYSMVVKSLYFQRNQIGFVLFEVGPQEGVTPDVLNMQISSALRGTRILEDLDRERNLLHTMIDNLPDYIYVKDREGRFIMGNTAVLRQMEVASLEELVGKSDFDFFPQELAERYYTEEQEIIQSEQGLYDYEGPAMDQGEERWISTTKVPLRDSQGAVFGFVGLGRDITAPRMAELALQRRALQLQTAAEVSHAASGTLDLDVLIQQAVDLVCERFDLYYAGLFLLDEPGEWVILRAGTGEAGQKMIAQGHKLKVGSASMIGACMANKEARIALDVGEEAARFDNPFLPETRSELALPLVSRGEAIGALTIQAAQESAFSDEDVIVLQTMADQLANAIANARLFDRAQTQADEMGILSELARVLSTRLTVQEVLDEVHRGASRLVDATNFYIALYDPHTHQVSFPYDTTQKEEDKFLTLSADQGITGYIIRHRAGVLIEEDVAERLAKMGIEMVGEPALSWLGVPMMVGDQVLGVMGVQSFTTPRAYDEHDQELLTALAAQVASALTNARLFEQTQAALAEVEATQRRYLERVWSEYAQTQRVSGYEQAGADLVPLDDALLPEVRQAMKEQRSVVLTEDDGASVLVVPVILRGQSLGAVGFKLGGEGRTWGADDIALVEGISEQFALAAENIRLLDETQRSAARERLTRDITDKMRRAASIDDVVQTAVDELFGALRTSRTFVRLGVTSSPQDDGGDKEESQIKEATGYD